MERWVVLLKSGDTQGNIDSWVYHKSFATQEEANDLGIAFCKDAEEQLIEMGAAFEYDGTYLFLKDGDAYYLMNSYDVYPVDKEDDDAN